MRLASDARLAAGLLVLSVVALAAFVVVGFGDLPSRALRSPSADPPPVPPTAGTEFVDVTESVGVGGFEHELRFGVHSIADAVAPGLGLLDLDDDGDLDLVLLGGPGAPVGVSIFANRLAERHELRFEDVTAKAGIDWFGAAQGVCAGDVDMDGDIDLFVTAIGGNLLLRSLFADTGELAFVDATDEAGLLGGRWYWSESPDPSLAPVTRPGAPPPELGKDAPEHEVPEFSTGATFGDVDGDGDLDLYVANYVSYFEKRYELLRAGDPNRPDRSEPIQFQPKTFESQPDRLYYNELVESADDLIFRDVTRQAQAIDASGRGLGAVFMRIDADVYPDLYITNDASENVFLRNVAVTPADGVDFKRRFEDRTVEFGLNDPNSGMGIARGDADGDADLDLLTTNWRFQSASLFLFRRETKPATDGSVRLEPMFDERGAACGLEKSTSPFVGWGCVFFDYDNDGDEDIFIGNGFTSPRAGTLYCTPEKPLLFRNDGAGHFVEVTSSAGAALSKAYAARGVVSGDLDQDGDLDLVIAQNAGPVVVLENRLPANGNRSLTYLVSLAPRRGDGVNVQVVADVAGRQLVQELVSGGSYLCQGPFEAHFGLGPSQSANRVQVTWPWVAGIPRVMVLREELTAGRHRVSWAPPEGR